MVRAIAANKAIHTSSGNAYEYLMESGAPRDSECNVYAHYYE